MTITGLTNGTTYTFTVTATNGVGTSTASATSNSVIPRLTLMRRLSPVSPEVTATPRLPSRRRQYGGSSIIRYTVTSNDGLHSATGGSSPIIVLGLVNGTTYTFMVTATNIVGTSSSSIASGTIIPAAVPDAPTIGTATASNGQATVTFTTPTNTGGSTITSYTVTSNDGLTPPRRFIADHCPLFD